MQCAVYANRRWPDGTVSAPLKRIAKKKKAKSYLNELRKIECDGRHSDSLSSYNSSRNLRKIQMILVIIVLPALLKFACPLQVGSSFRVFLDPEALVHRKLEIITCASELRDWMIVMASQQIIYEVLTKWMRPKQGWVHFEANSAMF